MILSPTLTYIAPDIYFAYSVIVHPFAYIGKLPSQSPSLARKAPQWTTVHIGEETEIGPHAILYMGAWIGERCLIGDGASVRENAYIGHNCIIGHHVCISYNARLADNVRVQNGTLIADDWQVGEGTFIGVNVTTMSDKRRDVVDYKFTGSTGSIIGKHCLIGSGSVLLPGINIGDNAVIGAGALVTKDVPPGATVLGQPARILATSLDWPIP